MVRKRGKRWTAEAYDRTTRRRVYLGTFDSRREAAEKEAAFKFKLRSRATGREPCDEFAKRWTRDYPRPRESTNKHNAERVARFAKDFKGVRMGDVDRPTARAWAMKHSGCLPAVRAMFGDAVRDGIVDVNPFSNLRLPGSRGRKDLVALTEQELTALADKALDPRLELGEYAPQYRAMILFAGYVGLRPGELFALRREDWHGDTANISKSYSSKTGQTTKPKTKAGERTVIVPPPARQALEADVPPHSGGLLFVTPAGKQWTQTAHHYYWSRLRLLADRPKLPLYALRHVACTFMLERGNTEADVAVQLGHDDGGRLIRMLYGHRSQDGARARLLASYGVTQELVEAPTPIRQGGNVLASGGDIA